MTASINKAAINKPDRYILFSLLLGIHLSVLPLYTGMPITIIILITALSLWQIIIIKRNKQNPGRVIQLAIILIIFLIILYSYGHIFGQQPGIALVTLMTILKLFESKTTRDCYIIIYSAFFIIASNFFHTQSIWLIIYVFLVVVFLLNILIALSDRLTTVPLNTRLRMAARFLIYALPLMLVLFFLFPRIPGPLWGLPDNTFSSQTGLSEEMSPGSINRLINSSAIAFRVSFVNEIPDHSQRYWRGAVLSLYDGKTWKRNDAPATAKANIRYMDQDTNKQHIFRYNVTLEPTNLNWLLSLEYPINHDPRYRFNREAMLITKNKITNVINYTIETQNHATNQALFAQESYKNRLLPVNQNPQTITLARELLTASKHDSKQYIDTVLSFFRNNNFIYTLSPDLLAQDAMDDFLFNSRRGFCEHYASAFVYLMRAAGIPSRVVVGYQGGKMNPLDNYMIVRQSDAHAWTEVWINDRWTRIDPTAAVSPNRIEQGIQNAGLEQNKLPLLLVSNNNFIKNVAFLYDSFQNSWNQWVIGFNQKKQNDLLKFLGFERATSSDLILLLVSCLTVTGFIIAWIVLKQNTTSSDRVQHFYNLFCQRLQRHGIQRKLHEGPVDFEKRIYNELTLTTSVKNNVAFVFKAYRNLHYGNHKNNDLMNRYIKKIKNIKLR